MTGEIEPIEPRDLGLLLSESFPLFSGGLKESAAIVAVTYVPAELLRQAVSWWTGIGLFQPDAVKAALAAGETAKVAVHYGAAAVHFAAAMFCFAALTVSAAERANGSPLDAEYALRRAADRFGAFLWTSLLKYAFIYLGALLFIIPGILLAIRYMFSGQAVLLDGYSGRAALGRSKEIVVARMGKALGNAFVGALVGWALLLGGLFVWGVATAPLRGLSGLDWVKTVVGLALWQVLGAWSVGFKVLLYRELAAAAPPQS